MPTSKKMANSDIVAIFAQNATSLLEKTSKNNMKISAFNSGVRLESVEFLHCEGRVRFKLLLLTTAC